MQRSARPSETNSENDVRGERTKPAELSGAARLGNRLRVSAVGFVLLIGGLLVGACIESELLQGDDTELQRFESTVVPVQGAHLDPEQPLVQGEHSVAMAPVDPAGARGMTEDLDSLEGDDPPPTTLADAIGMADFVGWVRVREVRGRHGTMGTAEVEAIWSDVTCEIIRAVTISENIVDSELLVLSIIGGSVGSEGFSVTHAPELVEGEELIVIARQSTDGWPIWRGTGGVLRVEDSRVLSYDGAPVVDIVPRGFVVVPPPVDVEREIVIRPAGDSAPPRRRAPRREGEALTPQEALDRLRVLVERQR